MRGSGFVVNWVRVGSGFDLSKCSVKSMLGPGGPGLSGKSLPDGATHMHTKRIANKPGPPGPAWTQRTIPMGYRDEIPGPDPDPAARDPDPIARCSDRSVRNRDVKPDSSACPDKAMVPPGQIRMWGSAAHEPASVRGWK